MLCLKHRKSLKGRKAKKIISLPSVKKNTRQKSLLAECQKKKHSEFFAECKKNTSLPSVFFCGVFFVRHSAKRLFVECPG